MKLRSAIVTMIAVLGVSSPVLGQAKVAPSWLSWDAGTSTATFKLIAGLRGGKSPFNFNGWTDGDLVLTVPENSTVVMNFVNEDGVPHSAEVIDGCGTGVDSRFLIRYWWLSRSPSRTWTVQ